MNVTTANVAFSDDNCVISLSCVTQRNAEECVMRWLTARIPVTCIVIALVVTPLNSQVQTPGHRSAIQSNPKEGRQKQLGSILHQRSQAAGGKLQEVLDADSADLAEDLPSLVTRSDEVLLVHIVITYGGVSTSGDSVQTQYDVQVLRSFKGVHTAGDTVRISVPLGGLLFSDGIQASKTVNSFLGLKNGGRYVLFLCSKCSPSEDGQSIPTFGLVGGGVQGAFMLDNEKVIPVYGLGALSKAYDKHEVSAFLAELSGLIPAQR
jgi:hypothetical protein